MTTPTINKTASAVVITLNDTEIRLSLGEARQLSKLQSGSTTYLGGDTDEDEDDDFEEVEVRCSYRGVLTFKENPGAGIYEDVKVYAAELA